MNKINKYALAAAVSLSLCFQGLCEESYEEREIKFSQEYNPGHNPKEECVVVRVSEKSLSADGKLQVTLGFINYYTTDIFLTEQPDSFEVYVDEFIVHDGVTFDWEPSLRRLLAARMHDGELFYELMGGGMYMKCETTLPDHIREKLVETNTFKLSLHVHGYYRQDGSRFGETIKIKEKLIEPEH